MANARWATVSAIAKNGAHFNFLLKQTSVTANSAAATAASTDAINESSRYMPFHVPAGKAVQIAIATMSKAMFAATSRMSILCALLFGKSGIRITCLGVWVFFNLVVQPSSEPFSVSFLVMRPVVLLGNFMSGNPLDAYREIDPKIIEQYENLAKLAYSEGALPTKFKLLLAMVIDVENGALEGAVILGKRAQKAGATKEEIVEASRVAYQIGGTRAIFTAAQLLRALF
jgi:alkylhydroperoxidase/carboxymuconolactone decarboxylase family protein YurZ